MERNAHSGQLNPVEFSMAALEDDAEIRALLGAVPMTGAWRIGFSREPSYFAVPSPAGIKEHTLVARSAGRIVSLGSWSERKVWLRGEPASIGYLHGLRLVPGTRGAMRILREGYAALASRLAKSCATGWFTSIDAANDRARQVLESRFSGLPHYTKLADYRTRVVPVSKRGPVASSSALEEPDELTAFLNAEGARHDLALIWDTQRWNDLAACGFTTDDVVVVRRHGRIIAAAGVWDQSAWKQVVVHGSPGWVRGLRPLFQLTAAALGWPGIPNAGCHLPMAPVFPFAIAPGEKSALPTLWRGLETIARARRIEWLALGLDATDPLWQEVTKGRMGFDYHTILHSVTGKGIPGSLPAPGEAKFRPECATL